MAGITFDSIADFERHLDWALDDAMQTEISEKVIEEIQEMGEKNVYSYHPKFNSRREKDLGGLIAPDTIFPDYDSVSKTLTVSLQAEWQTLAPTWVSWRRKDGSGTEGDLADIIQSKQIYNAPARSFVPEAEEEYSSKRFDIDLETSLTQRGL